MEGTPDQQMQKLKEEYERNLAQIKDQTAENGENSVEGSPTSNEHKAMSQAVEGVIQEEVPGFKALSHPPEHTNEQLAPDVQGQIQQRVNTAFTKGPYESTKGLKDVDPALIDEFHAALTGDLYRMLVEQKKLEIVK